MPTIAEILAARAARAAAAENASAAPATPPAPSAPRETLAEKAEAQAAIDRIDPPGKPQAAAGRDANKRMLGLILNKDMPVPPRGEPRGQATAIQGPDPDPEMRALGAAKGELIDVTPTDAPPQAQAWGQARVALEGDLCVMRDPADPEVCWLALKPLRAGLGPLLLHRLPWLLYEHPTPPQGEPF